MLKLLDRLDRGLVSNEELRELVTIQLDKRLKWGYKPTNEEQLAFHLEFINSLKNMDISGGNTEMINRELYEVPVPFLKLTFGKALKQSACYFKHQSMTIDEAEAAMHDLYCERAQIKDGLTILDIGCGQGALIFYIAQRNLNLQNVKVILADVTKYETEALYDRVIIIEALEHMKNIQLFLSKISKWMQKDALLFVDHVCHNLFAEKFEALDSDDWYSEYLFLKGSVTVIAASSLLYFQDDVSVLNHWILNGKHMARTHESWLKKLLNNRNAARDILKVCLGTEEAAEKCINHFRTFFLAMSEQYSCNNGEEWMISHVLFRKK
ncbi:hypothetical protein IFM89_005470 [Coptis chinensis]|uniref:Uncharacterized protein n=1 Tax=Coptis chinensis TaxID=261450 RepID=A0A835I854_9MAGN|nr:hypothetical protein IFM89_005470 [Coptis chinensis]